MKTILLPILRPIAVIAASILVVGCDEEVANGSADTAPPPIVQKPAAPPSKTPAAPSTNAAQDVASPTKTNAPTSTNAEPVITKKVRPNAFRFRRSSMKS